ncbi:MAG: 3-phosphoshikimate 1-carboxyvinyltransferase [Lachnospiraceae bacterium]|nr:3-phosphoshikimate 1-carboxyvinyltransferase [Lachnospiraceae bacterium]
MEFYKVPVVTKVNKDKLISVNVPGSKSITNRALLIAAMADGTSLLKGCLFSDDSKYFLDCLNTLGFETIANEETGDVSITGMGGKVPNKNAEIYVGSAGTAARFLVAMLAFSDGEYLVNSSEQMKKRPMMPLIETLRNAGAEIICTEEEGHFPLKIKGVGDVNKIPDNITVDIDKSSQFLSALLIAAGTLNREISIKIIGSHGLAYVDMTVSMMKDFGVNVVKEETEEIVYCLNGKDSYVPKTYNVEPDMSAAAYFYGLAAVTGAGVVVPGVFEDMLQGDVDFIDVLANMGCITENTDIGIVLQGPEDGRLEGDFEIDMSSFSDQALTLAAIAPYAEGEITISGISHIRLQECDRVNAIRENLKVLGVETVEEENSITIYPSQPHGGEIETYDDHRVAMAFSLTGLRTEGVTILNPGCCRKTFKEYFNVLDNVITQLEN